jgi:hypothetical protein
MCFHGRCGLDGQPDQVSHILSQFLHLIVEKVYCFLVLPTSTSGCVAVYFFRVGHGKMF